MSAKKQKPYKINVFKPVQSDSRLRLSPKETVAINTVARAFGIRNTSLVEQLAHQDGEGGITLTNYDLGMAATLPGSVVKSSRDEEFLEAITEQRLAIESGKTPKKKISQEEDISSEEGEDEDDKEEDQNNQEQGVSEKNEEAEDNSEDSESSEESESAEEEVGKIDFLS